MSISYEVKRLRSGSGDAQLSEQNGERRVIRTLEEQYIVIIDEDSVDANVPDPVSVGRFDGVPQVGGWSYYDAVNNIYYPNFTCRSVNIERDEQNAFIYNVTASYADESNDQSGQGVQSDPENYNPTINWSLESTGVTRYTARKRRLGSNSGSQPIKLPTGNFYDGVAPVKEVPVFVATVEQIENTLSLSDLGQRYKAINESSWQGFEKYSCKIDNITYERAQIPVEFAGQIIFQNVYKVKYVIKCLNHQIETIDDDASDGFLDAAWGYDLVRVDDWIMAPNDDGDLVPQPIMLNENSTRPATAYLKTTGEPLAEDFWSIKPPPVDQYITQTPILFSDFLRI
tara:strand:+ start:1927 stop:2952 length:1026 start_codon:yes stop_codon:yes gene_type:complete